MSRTTISVTDETKTKLDERKPDGQSWDAFLRESVLEDSNGSESPMNGNEFNVLDERLRHVEERLEALPRDISEQIETRFR